MKKIILIISMLAVWNTTVAADFPKGQCSADLQLTQNLKAPAAGEGYVQNGKYHWYTKNKVSEADRLQKHLNRLGFNAGKVDGIIGPNTKGAILRMQKFLGTKEDGYVGPKTRALLNNSCPQEKEFKMPSEDELINIIKKHDNELKEVIANREQVELTPRMGIFFNNKDEVFVHYQRDNITLKKYNPILKKWEKISEIPNPEHLVDYQFTIDEDDNIYFTHTIFKDDLFLVVDYSTKNNFNVFDTENYNKQIKKFESSKEYKENANRSEVRVQKFNKEKKGWEEFGGAVKGFGHTDSKMFFVNNKPKLITRQRQYDKKGEGTNKNEVSVFTIKGNKWLNNNKLILKEDDSWKFDIIKYGSGIFLTSVQSHQFISVRKLNAEKNEWDYVIEKRNMSILDNEYEKVIPDFEMSFMPNEVDYARDKDGKWHIAFPGNAFRFSPSRTLLLPLEGNLNQPYVKGSSVEKVGFGVESEFDNNNTPYLIYADNFLGHGKTGKAVFFDSKKNMWIDISKKVFENENNHLFPVLKVDELNSKYILYQELDIQGPLEGIENGFDYDLRRAKGTKIIKLKKIDGKNIVQDITFNLAN